MSTLHHVFDALRRSSLRVIRRLLSLLLRGLLGSFFSGLSRGELETDFGGVGVE
ncbi:MAG: hypothetical protein ACI9NQ_000732, partial [Paracoccaceae bacterium]